ncbi:PGAP1-like protein [Candidatus Magnetoovum chiemensis]|nr:PGAP1-like protein [Candidatus Magnetoovum chiemensis]
MNKPIELKDLDIVFHEGSMNSPLFVFIHGLGMNKNIWVYPEKIRVFAGNYPIYLFTSKAPDKIKAPLQLSGQKSFLSTGMKNTELKTLFHDLVKLNVSCLTWSQQRPANSINYALKELELLLNSYSKYTKNGIVLIGHSRGGLIARLFCLRYNYDVKGIITIGAPHKGSNMAKWADNISKSTSYISPYFEKSEKEGLAKSIKQILQFLQCEAIKELLPEAELIKTLPNKINNKIYTISAGGTKAELFTVYRVKYLLENNEYILKYTKLFAVPEILNYVVFNNSKIDDIINGKGDGLVSNESSIMPECEKHLTKHANHVELLFLDELRKEIINNYEFLTKITCINDRKGINL